LHIGQLMPNGIARDVDIFELDSKGEVFSTLKAERAIPLQQGLELHQVQKSIISDKKIESLNYDRLVYEGNLSPELLEVLMIEPRQMSSGDLRAYLNFLEENRLDDRDERLIFWQKLLAPLSIVVMCLLAFPFVLGSQRQGTTGQRLLIGILLGLAFAVVDKLVIQLGTQFEVNTLVIALTPNLAFLAIAIYMLLKKQSHGPGGSLFFSPIKT